MCRIRRHAWHAYTGAMKSRCPLLRPFPHRGRLGWLKISPEQRACAKLRRCIICTCVIRGSHAYERPRVQESRCVAPKFSWFGENDGKKQSAKTSAKTRAFSFVIKLIFIQTTKKIVKWKQTYLEERLKMVFTNWNNYLTLIYLFSSEISLFLSLAFFLAFFSKNLM